jgi:hypothetical protein
MNYSFRTISSQKGKSFLKTQIENHKELDHWTQVNRCDILSMYFYLKIYVKHCYRFRRTTHEYFWHYLVDCFRNPTICILVQVIILDKVYSNDNGFYVLCAYVPILESISLVKPHLLNQVEYF